MKVTEAFRNFLQARKTAANADLADAWTPAMETQLNVAPGKGESVAGKRSTWSDGINSWFNIRIPKNAATDPSFDDYTLTFPLEEHAEGIGCTGWDWQARCSRWAGFDFDAITGHAKGVGISDEALQQVKDAACALPYVEVRKSTGGGGIHLYVRFDGVPTANHTEHAALARCVLGMMASDTGFDFASQIDACGGVMWIWHRKMTAANQGLAIIKPATKVLTTADLPANWRDHIEVVTRRRTKVRINEIAVEYLDPFEALASSRRIVPLDKSHKAQIEALMRSGYTTLWIADHHLLQTHTCALQALMEGPEAKELKLKGLFKTDSQGRDHGSPNCFLFPLPDGGWKVYRFSQGVGESETWTQDGQGWTTCYFNRPPDLGTVCKAFGGVEDPDQGGFVFTKASEAIEATRVLGQEIQLPDKNMEDRRTVLKAHKDGRLIAQIESTKDDEQMPNWLDKKGKWVRVFDVKIDAEKKDDLGSTEYDNVVRTLKTPSRQFAGWMVRDNDEWAGQPSANVKMYLQDSGLPKNEAEAIMGGAVKRAWKLINIPFHPEFPGGRQWNMDAAQFRFTPVELADDEAPRHPHWDLIFNHFAADLTPALQELPWAQEAGIRTGGDYMKMWLACSFRDVFEPTPYIFAYGPEDCGKSIIHEAIKVLVTKGVVEAAHALTSNNDFNGELANAVICVVEEVDISKAKGAHAKIKKWVTSRVLAIRKMRTDVFEQPNTTHWIQCANDPKNCPVFPGDTRITVIYVNDLPPDKKIAKHELLLKLEEESPHFMRTLMDLQLPRVQDRLRLPVVATARKLQAEESNRTPLEQFIAECCIERMGERTLYKDFFDRFEAWLDPSERGHWSRRTAIKELPMRFPTTNGHANKKYVGNLVLRPEAGEAC